MITITTRVTKERHTPSATSKTPPVVADRKNVPRRARDARKQKAEKTGHNTKSPKQPMPALVARNMADRPFNAETLFAMSETASAAKALLPGTYEGKLPQERKAAILRDFRENKQLKARFQTFIAGQGYQSDQFELLLACSDAVDEIWRAGRATGDECLISEKGAISDKVKAKLLDYDRMRPGKGSSLRTLERLLSGRRVDPKKGLQTFLKLLRKDIDSGWNDMKFDAVFSEFVNFPTEMYEAFSGHIDGTSPPVGGQETALDGFHKFLAEQQDLEVGPSYAWTCWQLLDLLSSPETDSFKLLPLLESLVEIHDERSNVSLAQGRYGEWERDGICLNNLQMFLKIDIPLTGDQLSELRALLQKQLTNTVCRLEGQWSEYVAQTREAGGGQLPDQVAHSEEPSHGAGMWLSLQKSIDNASNLNFRVPNLRFKELASRLIRGEKGHPPFSPATTEQLKNLMADPPSPEELRDMIGRLRLESKAAFANDELSEISKRFPPETKIADVLASLEKDGPDAKFRWTMMRLTAFTNKDRRSLASVVPLIRKANEKAFDDELRAIEQQMDPVWKAQGEVKDALLFIAKRSKKAEVAMPPEDRRRLHDLLASEVNPNVPSPWSARREEDLVWARKVITNYMMAPRLHTPGSKAAVANARRLRAAQKKAALANNKSPVKRAKKPVAKKVADPAWKKFADLYTSHKNREGFMDYAKTKKFARRLEVFLGACYIASEIANGHDLELHAQGALQRIAYQLTRETPLPGVSKELRETMRGLLDSDIGKSTIEEAVNSVLEELDAVMEKHWADYKKDQEAPLLAV
jgi:hypothetical protein